MKRLIHKNDRYITDDVIISESVIVDISVMLPKDVAASSNETAHNVVLFPGVQQFQKDICEILENEYGFEVIEDVYDGIRQKGHVTNRQDSISVYFDTYYDLLKARPVLERIGLSKLPDPESGKVYCFIYIRFSDHELADLGNSDHRAFVSQTSDKYMAGREDIVMTVPDESIVLPERLVMRYYDKAKDDLRDKLDLAIFGWIRTAKKYKLWPD